MVDTSAPRPATLTPATASAAVCPYLLSADGSWRASTPSREHRCTAVEPAAALATDKQRRLCLTDAHTGCVTYKAAVASGAATPAGEVRRTRPGERPSARTIVRTAPLVLDHGRRVMPTGILRGGDRSVGQGALILLMVVAFAAIIVARLSAGDSAPPGGQVGGVTGTPRPTATASATSTATAKPTAKPTATPRATAKPTSTPTAKPSATAKPSSTPAATTSPTTPATYKVKRGDTLSGIATTYKTTVAALVKLNGIKDPATLRVGQVLKLR
jgi:LysM repeat protein